MSPDLTALHPGSLELELLVPDGLAWRASIRGLRATDASGQFGLRTGHERFVTVPTSQIMIIEDMRGHERFAAIDGGVLVLKENRISIACREAVVADQFEDVADAAARMLEGRRSQEKTLRAEFNDLQFALVRELRKVEHRR